MNTQDLSKLGYREIDMLGDLLKAYAENPNDCGLGNGVNWEYNPNSDNLFLIDEDYNIAMLDSDGLGHTSAPEQTGKLAKWYDCPNCGHEGFKRDFEITSHDDKQHLACPDCLEKGANSEDYLIEL